MIWSWAVTQKINAVVTEIQKQVPGNTITRPSNTTAYAVGDALSNDSSNDYITFADVTRGGKNTATLVEAVFMSSANQSTLPALDLLLFDRAFTETADNSPCAITDAEMVAGLIGVVSAPVADWNPVNAAAGASGNAMCHVTDLAIRVRTKTSENRDIYGQLVLRNTYTPVSDEQFDVLLKFKQD